METKSDLITYCLTYKDVYEDYPFRDHEWTVIRHRGNKRVFAWIYRREGQVCINLKCAPEWIEFWRKAYSGVRPGYHLNKKHWNTVVLVNRFRLSGRERSRSDEAHHERLRQQSQYSRQDDYQGTHPLQRYGTRESDYRACSL